MAKLWIPKTNSKKIPKLKFKIHFSIQISLFSPYIQGIDYVCIKVSFYICWYFLSEYKTHCAHSLSCLIINPHTLLNMDENLKPNKNWTLSLRFKSKLIFWTTWSYKIFEPSSKVWSNCMHHCHCYKIHIMFMWWQWDLRSCNSCCCWWWCCHH